MPKDNRAKLAIQKNVTSRKEINIMFSDLYKDFSCTYGVDFITSTS
jgi:hypothetical protein